jgi:nucleotide-binding universal stress UspA family protein
MEDGMTNLKRILVPLDGSTLSESALPLATLLAQKFGSEIILLRVAEVPFLPAATGAEENHWVKEALQYEYRTAQTYLNHQQAELAQQGIPTRTLVRDESPAEDILFVARNQQIDLIVISSHGKSGPSPWTAGSVADKVMHHSPCPVLLVRQNQEQGRGNDPERGDRS